jgi:purine-binding chemotaxis protein CheW
MTLTEGIMARRCLLFFARVPFGKPESLKKFMTTTFEAPASAPTAGPGKYLAFFLGHESYALPVLQVREIIRVTEITPVPHMAAGVKGIINLRGKLVPVMDLRVQFGLDASGFGERACIIVARVKSAAGEDLPIGFIVDAVEEVLNLAAKDIEKAPDFGGKASAASLCGMANLGHKVIALLDIDQVFAPTARDLQEMKTSLLQQESS